MEYNLPDVRLVKLRGKGRASLEENPFPACFIDNLIHGDLFLVVNTYRGGNIYPIANMLTFFEKVSAKFIYVFLVGVKRMTLRIKSTHLFQGALRTGKGEKGGLVFIPEFLFIEQKF